jgi:hypothetical protein
MLLFKNILTINFDVPTPWGIYFQDSASPQFEGLVELHELSCIRAKLREHPKTLVTKEIKETIFLA